MTLIIRIILWSLVGYLLYDVFIGYKPSAYVEKNLPAYGVHNDAAIRNYEAIVQIKSKSGGCSAVVVDDNYVLTAAHCVQTTFGHDKSPIEVFDHQGGQTDSHVYVAAFYPDYDVALLRGDLSEFKYIELESYHAVQLNKYHVSCGFPSLQNRVSCVPVLPTSNYYFYISATGFIIRGMSGGPVIDPETGKVIGVNSAAGPDRIFIAPTFGILGLFNIE